MSQLVNVIAPIMTDDNGKAWAQSIFYPFMQASTMGRGTVLTPITSAETYSTKEFHTVSYLDSIGVLNDAGNQVTVFAVNKSLDTPMQLHVGAGTFDFKQVTGATQFAGYAPKQTAQDAAMHIAPNTKYTLDATGLTIELPPLSWNTVQIAV
jgi:alpha-N-arabinofuranosidase